MSPLHMPGCWWPSLPRERSHIFGLSSHTSQLSEMEAEAKRLVGICQEGSHLVRQLQELHGSQAEGEQNLHTCDFYTCSEYCRCTLGVHLQHSGSTILFGSRGCAHCFASLHV
jgi:hypothetical protein